MPTYKEISKIKTELLDRSEDKIKQKLNLQQENLYDSLIDDFVKVAKNKVDGKDVDIYKLQSELKKQYELYFPEVMAYVAKTSESIVSLNDRYFSTLVDSNRLGEIQDKTYAIIDKTLGVKDNGKLISGGFIDKVIENKNVQKLFTKRVNAILDGSPDIVLMQTKLKEFITGSKESTGLLERHYRTFASDLISNIDRTGSLVYANELDLQHFYYSGGVILSSRSFCESKNGKVFTRAQAERWKDSAFITSMYDNINDYEPLIDMGGYGCRHRPDWITADLAEKIRSKSSENKVEKSSDDKKNIIKTDKSSVVKTKEVKAKPTSKESPKAVVLTKEEYEVAHQNWIKTRPYKEAAEIETYTGTDHASLNYYLRNGKTYSEKGASAEVWDKVSKDLSDILKDAPKYTGTVFRGLSIDDKSRIELINSLKIGGLYTDKAFMSTSKSESVASDSFGNFKTGILFEIESVSGVDISQLSRIRKEQEVLFDKNSKFKVVEMIKNNDLGSYTIKLIQL